MMGYLVFKELMRQVDAFPPEPFHFGFPKKCNFLRPVGRQHQPDLFESWLSNEELRSCISRLAFEAVESPSDDGRRFLGLSIV